MSYEAFREQCAQIAERMPDFSRDAFGPVQHRIATTIRALPLPEVKQEPVNFKPLSSKVVEQGWRDTFSVNNPYCPCDLRTFEKSVIWAERELGKQFTAILTENEQLRQRIAELEQEAHEKNQTIIAMQSDAVKTCNDFNAQIAALKGGAA